MVSFCYRCSDSLLWMKMSVLILILSSSRNDYIEAARLDIPERTIRDWGRRVGLFLQKLGDHITNYEEILRGFQSARAFVRPKPGLTMVKKMSADIEAMMAKKIDAVARITYTAEEAKDSEKFDANEEYIYINAKTLNKEDGINLTLTEDPHFYGLPVNVTRSVIHVPTNVFDRAKDVVKAIKWSEKLTLQFSSNYRQDPSLTWQYFCSSIGFLRQYPAIPWDSYEWDSIAKVDTYDCRMRLWYIEAAASPKDMIILMDLSGSMTGKKKEIAKHVALNILDTLNDDDFFTIMKFHENVTCLVSCFEGSLVPASMENIREFKNVLRNLVPEKVADFSAALTKAFNLLKEYQKKENAGGARCNQAIMLITDEAPQMYEDIFKFYNQPERRVRLFTYQIGEELADDRALKWMACTNRGFYTHVSTIAEAREQVQHYVPVMARPLVLNESHTHIWTSVYADVEDPKTSDYRWEYLNKVRQREKIELYLELQKNGSLLHSRNGSNEVFEPAFSLSPPMDFPESDIQYPIYRLMTTVAHPVFDKQNASDRILGVAGTDVPIEDITKLSPAHKLGVNGYSFAITNNGYVLFHPDLRPVHYTATPILKPDYNSVDLTEVELADDDHPPRSTETDVLKLRELLIDRNVSTWKMTVNIHLDNMRRLATRTQHYFFAPLNATPFSFCIVFPDGYGMNEVVGRSNISNFNVDEGDFERRVVSLFSDNWTIHPDWVYCEYLFNNPNQALDREERLIDFLRLLKKKNFAFKFWELPTQNEYSNIEKIFEKNYYHCDRELLENLVFDANATKNHSADNGNRNSTARDHNVTLAFLATRSGLTRWTFFRPDDDDDKQFIRTNPRSIDELWYKRAVDYYTSYHDSYVFSLELRNSDDLPTERLKVTATRAIFLKTNTTRMQDERRKVSSSIAPVAVVGFRMDHSGFAKEVEKHLDCLTPEPCIKACPENSPLSCYLLDDHGYIIYSRRLEETGLFSGMVIPDAMDTLVSSRIYRRVSMVDYQAVCPDQMDLGDSGSFLSTPFAHLTQVFSWIWGRMLSFYINYHFFGKWAGVERESAADGCTGVMEGEEEPRPHVSSYFLNKTRPKPCDKGYFLYQLNTTNHLNTEIYLSRPGCRGPNDEPCEMTLGMTLVGFTNLLLVVVNRTCNCDTSEFDTEQIEIDYEANETCAWLGTNIYRSRPTHCTSFHPQELTIQGYCGQGYRPEMQALYGVSVPALVLMFYNYYTSI